MSLDSDPRQPMHLPLGYLLVWLLSLVWLACVSGEATGQDAVTLTNSEAAVAALLRPGSGTFILNFDGTLTLPQTVVVTGTTLIDATGHDVSLDGGQQLRHFSVNSGAT